MAQRDYRTPQAPGALPAWMLSLGPNERPGHVMGNAEMDQYQNGGQPPTGSLGDYLINGFQGLTSIDPQGYAVQGTAPTFGDRMGRAAQGALTGYDFGNTGANVAAGVGASFVPGGSLVNSGAGAVQGYRSNALDFDRVLPNGGNSAPPDLMRPDVMPRGIYSGWDSMTSPMSQPDPFNAGGMGGGSVQNPLTAPTSGAQTARTAPAGAQFTGGSGALVNPYQLPEEASLVDLLANGQRYTDYDASTGRVGTAGAGVGGYASAGFDFSQDAGNRDIGKSAKYAFAHLADRAAAAGVPQPRTKADAEAWFNQYIAPGMTQLGYPVSWVQGDKAQIQTREGLDTIDYLGGAGGDSPALTWQSEVLAPGGGAPMTGTPMGGAPSADMDLTSSALFDALLKEARRIAAGESNGASVLDTQSLLSLMAR